LSKSKEPGTSSSQLKEPKSEVKEEVELDPELSAIPPPSMKCELECKQEEGFTRPKILNVKCVLSVCIMCSISSVYRPMEKNVFKSASAEVKPVIKPKEKVERLVCQAVC